jgi:sialate O-acetylesterase
MSKSWSVALAVALAFGLGGCSSLPVPDFLASATTTTTVQSATKPEFPPRPLTLLYTTFQDHAVLQRDKPIPVWGLTSPGARVSVTLAGETVSATADALGNWETMLTPLKAGGPYVLSAKSDSGKRQTVKDILIGDVYLCSGQSNMEFPERLASNYDADLNAATNTSIRLLHVQRYASITPRDTFGADATWAVTSPDAVREFSAVCYNFGKNLQPIVNIPIGLIEDSWGGSVIQTWISSEKIRELGGYEHQLAVMAEYTKNPEASLKKWMDYTDGWWLQHDPGSAAAPAWRDPAYDDSSWDQIVPAGWWESWGIKALSAFDGTVWFRKTFTLTAAQAKGDAVLSLGPVDDIDTTWINGIEVGGQEGWDTKRVYKVPAGTLHEGANLIAVGVLDTGDGGGMWGTAEAKNLKLANGSLIVLNTPWRYKISAPLSQTGGMAHAPWLKESGLSMLYDGMIQPVGPTAMRAILWYQGESDTWQPQEYGRLLPALIGDWRRKFGADLPFIVVQLPGYGPPSTKPEASVWADLREVQREVANDTANTGLAVTIDLGHREYIHPANKQEVGRRLALVAERMIYGMSVADSGPTPVSAVRTGNTVAVSFVNVAHGLAIYESGRPISFEVCDGVKQCSFVDATQNKDEIDLDVALIRDAASVRFCWADSPICNVYNSEGLPAVPFEIPIAPAAPARVGTQLVRKPNHSHVPSDGHQK